MKSQNSKRIILAVLVVVLAIIWWDNIKLFHGNNHQYDFTEAVNGKTDSIEKREFKQLAFKPPRVNPFRKPNTTSPVEKPKVPKVTSATIKIEKPSSKHKLLGVIKDKVKSQAVMNSSQGGTSVLSLSDSLENWVLIVVDTSYVVFRNDKIYDTLWLEINISLQ